MLKMENFHKVGGFVHAVIDQNRGMHQLAHPSAPLNQATDIRETFEKLDMVNREVHLISGFLGVMLMIAVRRKSGKSGESPVPNVPGSPVAAVLPHRSPLKHAYDLILVQFDI
jgi:hypothetical protein